MNFDERQHWTHKIFSDAVWNGEYILVVGSGIWFEVLEASAIRCLNKHYECFLSDAAVVPALQANFKNGGRVQFVDFGPPARGEGFLTQAFGIPDLVYLVEDAPGVNFSSWSKLVEPLLNGILCPVILLGEASV